MLNSVRSILLLEIRIVKILRKMMKVMDLSIKKKNKIVRLKWRRSKLLLILVNTVK